MALTLLSLSLFIFSLSPLTCFLIIFLFPSTENPAFPFYAAYPSLSPPDQKESPEVSLHLPPSAVPNLPSGLSSYLFPFFPRLLLPYFFSKRFPSFVLPQSGSVLPWHCCPFSPTFFSVPLLGGSSRVRMLHVSLNAALKHRPHWLLSLGVINS